MNEEERFDELLSSKLSEREFPFNELNWDEAERLIVRQEKWRRSLRFFLIFSAGIMAGIAIMLPFIFNKHSAIPNTIVSKSTLSPKPIIQDNVPLLANQPKENITNKNIQSKENASKPIQSTFTERNNRIASHPIAPNGTSILASAPKVNKPLNRYQAKPSIVPSNELIPVQQTTNINSLPVIINSIPEIELPPTDSIFKVVVLPAQVSHASKEDSQSQSRWFFQRKGVPKKADSIQAKNDSSNAKTPPIITAAKPSDSSAKHNANILSVDAGGNYSFGWNKEANGITPFGGFNFTHYFTKKISASIGVGYLDLNNLDNTYISNTMKYNFGAESNIIDITPQTIYYIAFPLSFQYDFDDKNKIGLGCNYLMMLTTSSLINTYQQTYFGETLVSSQKQKGYTDGVSKYDFQVILTYTRMLTSRLGIGAEVYLGLINIENSSFFSINQYDKNDGLSLILSYQLIK